MRFAVWFLFCCVKNGIDPLEIDRGYLVGNHGYNSLIDMQYFFPDTTTSAETSTKSEIYSGNMAQGKKLLKLNTSKRPGEKLLTKSIKIQTPKSKSNENIAPKKFTPIVNGTSFEKNRMKNVTPVSNRDTQEMYEVPVLDSNQKLPKSEGQTSKFTMPDIFKRGKNVIIGIMRTLRGENENVRTNIVNDVDSEGRFLNLFQVVTFNNVDCLSSSGLRGTCLHPFECSAASGTEMGICADGYGVCCKFEYSCGEQSSANCSTFTNPGFPKPSEETLSCTLTVQKAHNAVNQLRLNFVQMELQPPTNGTCVDDQFVITGQNINSIIPILCGINNGQHMYVEVGDASGPFYISILSATGASRIFQIEICQISAGEEDSAPSGCLQYYTTSDGELESFNYQLDGIVPAYRAPGYFNNLNYAICIQRAAGSCSITYSTSDGANGDNDFQILNYDPDGIPLIPPEQAGAEIFNCPDDFIIVNGIRLCGERLNDASVTEDFTVNAPVTEFSAGPIALIFRTNGNVTGRGFHLSYKQNSCAASKAK